MNDVIFDESNEVELSNEKIKEIVNNGLWVDVKSLTSFANMGAKWNIKRNSIVFPEETFKFK